MTREQAIQAFYCPDLYGGLYGEEYRRAIDMAIKSLKAWDRITEQINEHSLGEWYVGRIDGKSEEIIPVETVINIINEFIQEIEKGGSRNRERRRVNDF